MDKLAFFERFRTLLEGLKRFVIVSHVNPDGDAIGSSLGLYHFLKKYGHDVTAMVPNDYPSYLSWVPGINDLIIFDKSPEHGAFLLEQADYILCLDFNSFSRCGLIHNDLRKSKAKKILIDHHTETDYSLFDMCLSDTNVSSTSELVAQIVMTIGKDSDLDCDIATDVLVGIITDTNSFAHSIFHPGTFEICSKLITRSLPYKTIHQMIYDTMSENRLRLLGFAISNKMQIFDEYSTAIITLSKQELESFNYQIGDTEGIVNYPLSMEKIKMSVLITEKQGIIRLSFRSKGNFSVHELAKKYFGGGGHVNAAGGTMSCPLKEAEEALIAVLPEYKKLLNEPL